MAYEVERALDTDRDLAVIFDFLVGSYREFGEDLETAVERAATRIRAIETAMLALGQSPHQGNLRPELGDRLRAVTKDRAVFYFDVDDERRLVRVLAVFFGGQDHQRRMLRRLMG